jgi:hypothetical protein
VACAKDESTGSHYPRRWLLTTSTAKAIHSEGAGDEPVNRGGRNEQFQDE